MNTILFIYSDLAAKNIAYILISLIFFIVYIFFSRKLMKKLSEKAPNWQLFFLFAHRLMTFLLLLMLITINLESNNIKINEFLSTNLIHSKKYQLTPYIILVIIIILIATRAITVAMRSIFLNKIKREKNIDYGNFNIYKLVNYVIWLLAVFIVLELVGIQLTIVLAGSAALLVGVGIGMQQIFNDSISGFFLLFERSLKINDIVEMDGIVGRVQDIGIRTSRIITYDNIEMIVPNSKLVSATVINWSSNDHKTRFFLKVGVAYGSDVALVKKILIEVANAHSLILKNPSPIVLFSDFGDSSLNFELGFWTKKTFEHKIILSDLRFAIDKKFREHNITIPFPQRDIHIIKNQ